MSIVVLPLRRWPTPVPSRATSLVVTEYDLEIGEERAIYTVHRAVGTDDGRGFITIKDSEGRLLFISRDMPDECVPPLIVAYRCGLERGRAQMMESLS